MEKELEKLEDLEFEYNVARLSRQSEEVIRLAKGKYRRQLKKILKMQKEADDEISNKTQEEQGLLEIL